jgi:hypothetical protein
MRNSHSTMSEFLCGKKKIKKSQTFQLHILKPCHKTQGHIKITFREPEIEMNVLNFKVSTKIL